MKREESAEYRAAGHSGYHVNSAKPAQFRNPSNNPQMENGRTKPAARESKRESWSLGKR
jgi:hypothetical protein